MNVLSVLICLNNSKMNFVRKIANFIRDYRIIGIDAFKLEFYPILGKRKVTVKLNGYRYPISLRCNMADYITYSQVFLKKDYEFDILNTLNPSVIIDCGANIGLTSVYYRNKYPGVHLISIEPEDNNYQMLIENMKYYENVLCLKNGVWNKKCNLNIVDKSVLDNSFVVCEFPGSLGIQAVTIGDIVKDYNLDKIDILKIDIEGSEKRIFSGGYETWLPLVKVLIIELHDRFVPGCAKAVFDALVSYKYKMYIKGESVCLYFEK